MLNQAFLSSQRMVFLISDLLNVSRLKTGKFVIERTKVDLASLIDQEISQLQEVAAGRGLELTFDKPRNFPLLMLDETKTRQVVMNFVDNAIHYTPSGGHISVELAETRNNIELRVRDDGIGVPKSDQHHLFTKFYRAPNAQRARPDGTGLGLFMAKKVIVAQGGAVIFESRERKGSVFGFTIPKQKIIVPAVAPVAPVSARQMS
jgi:signal transduction histidine kinase